MPAYRVRRSVVEAYRFDGDVVDLAEFLGMDEPDDLEPADRVIIELPTGEEQLVIGDYVVRSDYGSFDPHPGAHFDRLYEEYHPPDVSPPPADNPDVMVWARSFEHHFPAAGIDASTMAGWFTNFACAVQAAAS